MRKCRIFVHFTGIYRSEKGGPIFLGGGVTDLVFQLGVVSTVRLWVSSSSLHF